MKLLLLSFYYPPDLSAGSFRTKALVDALYAQEADNLCVEIIASMPNRYQSMSSTAPEFEESQGLTIRRIQLPTHQSGMADQSKAFLTYARAVLRESRGQQWDIVFATSSRLMTAALGSWVARRTRASLYLDIRDLFTDTMADLLRKSALRGALPVLRRLEKWTLRSASRVNLVSAGFLPHVQRVAPEHDYRVFTNGIDEEFLRMDFSYPHSQPHELPLVIYAGNMGEGQGLHNVIPEAARLLKGKVRFRLLGDGGRRRLLEESLLEADVSNVEILNPVPRNELYTHYREADVLFLHLNDHDAFRKVLPSKLFEYAATEKPILAGVAGYAAEFLRREVPGVVVFEPCDAVSMAAAIERVVAITQPVDRRSFCARFSRKRIMQKMADDVLDLYDHNR